MCCVACCVVFGCCGVGVRLRLIFGCGCLSLVCSLDGVRIPLD